MGVLYTVYNIVTPHTFQCSQRFKPISMYTLAPSCIHAPLDWVTWLGYPERAAGWDPEPRAETGSAAVFTFPIVSSSLIRGAVHRTMHPRWCGGTPDAIICGANGIPALSPIRPSSNPTSPDVSQLIKA